jgi:hypothetical protein
VKCPIEYIRVAVSFDAEDEMNTNFVLAEDHPDLVNRGMRQGIWVSSLFVDQLQEEGRCKLSSLSFPPPSTLQLSSTPPSQRKACRKYSKNPRKARGINVDAGFKGVLKPFFGYALSLDMMGREQPGAA